MKVGKLTVISHAGKRNGGHREHTWRCKCECGNECIVWGSNLRKAAKGTNIAGATYSCGCLQRERTAKASLRHGLRRRKYGHTLEYYRFRRRDPHFLLKQHLKHAVWSALKFGSTSQRRLFSKLPFTVQELRSHIESQFEPWMSWNNYGEWHLDHIFPQSKLRYTSLDDPLFLKCWSLSNLRPLRSSENISKAARIPC